MDLRVIRSTVPSRQNRATDGASAAAEGELLPVYIVDQNRLACRYLQQILAKNRSLHAVTLEEMAAFKPTERGAPIFVIDRGGIDLALSECLRVLRERHPNAKFVVVDQEQPSEEIVRLLSFGIHGFVAHPQIGEQLAQAVHCVAQGKMWITSHVLEAYVQHSTQALKGVNHSPTAQGITQRESQVIELVKRRLSNKEIGAILNIRESTVKFHLSNIFSKLQINRRSELQDRGQLSEIWRKLIAC